MFQPPKNFFSSSFSEKTFECLHFRTLNIYAFLGKDLYMVDRVDYHGRKRNSEVEVRMDRMNLEIVY